MRKADMDVKLSKTSAAEDVVGLDVSNGIISAARLAASPNGSLRLLNAGWAKVAPGASDRELATAIRDVWRSAGLPSRTVCASLRSRSAILRYFSYPAMEQVELVAALGLEAEDSLQLPRQQIMMDWHLNLKRQGHPAGRREGLMVAVPKKDVETQLGILRQAGVYPVTLDLGVTAVANLFQVLYPDAQAQEDTAVLHLTSQGADIALLFGGDSLYARSFYARGAGWEQSLNTLWEGVQDAIKFYTFKLRSKPVRRLMVSGRLPAGTDVVAELKTRLGIPVEAWDPLTRMTAGSGQARRVFKDEQKPPLAVCLGLALRRYGSD